MTTATFALEKLDGTTKAARDQLDGNKSGDLWRAYNYALADDEKNEAKFYLKTSERHPWRTRRLYAGLIPDCSQRIRTTNYHLPTTNCQLRVHVSPIVSGNMV